MKENVGRGGQNLELFSEISISREPKTKRKNFNENEISFYSFHFSIDGAHQRAKTRSGMRSVREDVNEI